MGRPMLPKQRTHTEYRDADAVRARFPVTKHCVYLSLAATATLPDTGRLVVSTFIEDCGVWSDRKQSYARLSDDMGAALVELITTTLHEIRLA